MSLGWSPQTAITQLPLFVWLEAPESSLTQSGVDSSGSEYSHELTLQNAIWKFQVVNGRGDSWSDSVTCRSLNSAWEASWIDLKGNPTPAARAAGACWYTYRHMGDGTPRSVEVAITWSVKSCRLVDRGHSCRTTTAIQQVSSSVSVTEIQALVS